MNGKEGMSIWYIQYNTSATVVRTHQDLSLCLFIWLFTFILYNNYYNRHAIVKIHTKV